jgi:hypothetical protein
MFAASLPAITACMTSIAVGGVKCEISLDRPMSRLSNQITR